MLHINEQESLIPMDPMGSEWYEEQFKNWKQKFKDIKPGNEDFKKYEKLCFEILKELFYNDLNNWNLQQKTEDDLYRFDLICKIKNENNLDFFNTLKYFFNSKYSLTEF